MYVSGSAIINKHLNISSDSKMCVAGNATPQKVNSGGLLVVKGTINGQKNSITEQDFLQKCGTASAPALNIEWGDKVLNSVNYEY